MIETPKIKSYSQSEARVEAKRLNQGSGIGDTRYMARRLPSGYYAIQVFLGNGKSAGFIKA